VQIDFDPQDIEYLPVTDISGTLIGGKYRFEYEIPVSSSSLRVYDGWLRANLKAVDDAGNINAPGDVFEFDMAYLSNVYTKDNSARLVEDPAGSRLYKMVKLAEIPRFVELLAANSLNQPLAYQKMVHAEPYTDIIDIHTFKKTNNDKDFLLRWNVGNKIYHNMKTVTQFSELENLKVKPFKPEDTIKIAIRSNILLNESFSNLWPRVRMSVNFNGYTALAEWNMERLSSPIIAGLLETADISSVIASNVLAVNEINTAPDITFESFNESAPVPMYTYYAECRLSDKTGTDLDGYSGPVLLEISGYEYFDEYTGKSTANLLIDSEAPVVSVQTPDAPSELKYLKIITDPDTRTASMADPAEEWQTIKIVINGLNLTRTGLEDGLPIKNIQYMSLTGLRFPKI
jgi:hypothetical protein